MGRPRIAPRTPAQMLDYIHARCDEVGDCWIWRGARSASGYPIATMTHFATQYVHLVAWTAHHDAPVPEGLRVRRTCNDKGCCNPLHLRLATPSQLNREAALRGAFSAPARRMAIAKGVRRSGNAKLTVRDVLRIRSDMEPTCVALARELGVSKALISRIRKGVGWPGVGLASHMALAGLGSQR